MIVAKRLIMRLDDGELEAGEFRCSGDMYELACPACGHCSQLDTSIHSVSRGGAVSLRWVCPSQSCSLAEFLHLEVCV